ncbi:hypothetical protein MRS44_005910 [Fusarium solani]|uniref:uncharacterized protein n=1 Tax=Fusarium solani TaxID=169388 RepID=UPI0032C3D620|nr:hypothetical protein MRS44_005910 [Fusarium solani]
MSQSPGTLSHRTQQQKPRTSHSSLMPLPLLRPPTHTHIHTTTHTLVQTIIPAAAPLLVEPPENRAGVPKSASSWWEKVVYSGEKAEDLKSFSLAGVPSAGGDWGPLFGCLPNLPSTQNAMRRWRIWQRSREAAAAAWGISPSRSRQAGNQKSTPLACWSGSMTVFNPRSMDPVKERPCEKKNERVILSLVALLLLSALLASTIHTFGIKTICREQTFPPCRVVVYSQHLYIAEPLDGWILPCAVLLLPVFGVADEASRDHITMSPVRYSAGREAIDASHVVPPSRVLRGDG